MGLAYLIATYDITDPERYESQYVPLLVTALAAAGAEVVVATGSGQALEGTPPGQTVVLRFPSEASLRGWYEADEHRHLHALRQATTANATLVLARGYGAGSGSVENG